VPPLGSDGTNFGSEGPKIRYRTGKTPGWLTMLWARLLAQTQMLQTGMNVAQGRVSVCLLFVHACIRGILLTSYHNWKEVA
jgi:hypothetical protein